MTSFNTTEAWNAYHNKFGYEPTDAQQLHKFTKSSAGKHVTTLSFKDAQTVYKLNKGKGKINTSPSKNTNSKKKRNSALLKKRKSASKPNTPSSPNTPTLTPEMIHFNSGHRNSKTLKRNTPPPTKRKSKSNKSRTPTTDSHTSLKRPPLKSSKSAQLSPPSKSKPKHKKSSSKIKHKKNASNMNKKKRKSKSKKINKEREIRSTLYNNPTDPSLDSILEILRRATLVKKQKKKFEKEQRELAEQKEKELVELREQREKERQLKLEQESEKERRLNKKTSYTNDLTTTDLDEFRSKLDNMRKETDELFQMTVSADGSVKQQNPLFAMKRDTYIEEDSSDDEGIVDVNGKGIMLGVIDDEKEIENINNDDDYNREISVSVSVDVDDDVGMGDDVYDDDECGYETPPELFRDDEVWDWSENDIVFKDGALNYGISLQLLHLGLTHGPLFPNSILKWKRLKFKENGPTPRSGHVSAFINDKMVVFGGYSQELLTDHIFLVDTNDYDIKNASLEVTPISSLEKIHKTYRVGHCGVSISHNNCLYLFGGWNDQKYINHGLLFNVDSLKLVVEQTKDRILPSPRRDHTLCKMGSCLLLFGGWSHDYDGNELWLLSSKWKWQQLDVTGTPPCPRRGHTANVIGIHMYIFGGLYGFSKYLNDLHIYNGDTSEWIQPELVGINRPPVRAWHTSNTIGSQILFFGGTSGRTNFLNDIWVFDTCGYFWFQIECHNTSPLPRCSHTMVKIFQDHKFMNDAFTNECIKINKDGKIENGNLREKRLAFIMFGGLIAKNIVKDDEKKENEKKDKNINGNKKKKKKKNIKGSNLLDEVKADISKQKKKQSKVNMYSFNNDGKNELKPNAIKISNEGQNDSKSDDEKKNNDNNNNKNDDVFSSDSEREEDIEPVNRIVLSDDLYALILDI